MQHYRFGPDISNQDPTPEIRRQQPIIGTAGRQAQTRIQQQQRRSQRTNRTMMMNRR